MRHTLKHALLAHTKLVCTHGTLVADLATKNRHFSPARGEQADEVKTKILSLNPI